MSRTLCNDDAFGPVSECRPFDFTLTFENVLLILTSGSFIVSSLVQITYVLPLPSLVPSFWTPKLQWRQADVVGLTRALLALIHSLLSAAMMGICFRHEDVRDVLVQKTSLPALLLAFISSILFIPLTILCRARLAHGSYVPALYLFIVVLVDSCRLRTYHHIQILRESAFFDVSVSLIILKGLMLFVENTSGVQVTSATKESRASFFSRMIFWWLKDVLWGGFRRPLDMVNLEHLSPDFDSEMLGAQLSKTWQKQMKKAAEKMLARSKDTALVSRSRLDDVIELQELDQFPSRDSLPPSTRINVSSQMERAAAESAAASKTLLLKSCFFAFPGTLIAPVVPRMINTGVTLALPYLATRTIAFAESYADSNIPQPVSYGWGLVGAYALTFLVQAFSSGQFYWMADKGQVKLRGALIDLIYRKSLRMHLTTASRIGDGAVTNLMAVDLERFCRAIIPFHLLYSGLIQVGISCFLLYKAIGWSFIASLVSITLFLTFPPIVGRGIGDKQANWSKSTDRRVNLVSSAVSNAKGVKYMAYEKFVEDSLIDSRKEEIHHGWRYYKRLLLVSSFTNLVMEVTALCTFSTMILVDHITGSDRFNPSTVVTAMTLISLMETPLLQMGQQYGGIIAALVSLRRIQNFLGKDEKPNNLGIDNLHDSFDSTNGASIGDKGSIDGAGGNAMGPRFASAASFHSATIGWTERKPVLVNVTLDIPLNELTMVCGPLGSGKSTLLQALLGEVDVFAGSLYLPTTRKPIAYAAQESWLQDNASIRDNITLQSGFDTELYQSVLFSTCFHIDLQQLPEKDDTPAKALSGGQRQRVALARALYSQADTYILDDFTSALDAETASHVWKCLMGPVGLLRNKTVIFATNAVHLLHHAAFIVRLEGGKVVEMGAYKDLSDTAKVALSRASVEESLNGADEDKVPDLESMVIKGGDNHENVEKGSVKLSVYKEWIRAIGIAFAVITILSNIVVIGAKTGWSVYLQYFSRADATAEGHANVFRWYGGFVGLICTALIGVPVSVYSVCYAALVVAGTKLHTQEVRGIWSTGLKFFESNPPGMIINRFSQDLFVIDWELTIALSNFIPCSLEVLAQILLLVIPVPYLLIVVVGVGCVYVLVQRLYAPVSRQLRRLEMATKSPLYSLFSETSKPAGLATVRALRRQQKFIDTNTARLNRSQQPYYTLQAVRRWLLTSLNLLALIINVSLVAIVVIVRKSSAIGVLGAGLISASQLSIVLNQVLVAFTELEIASVALERVVGFASLPIEETHAVDGVLRKTLKHTDVRGDVSLQNVSLKYGEEAKPALRDITLTIRAGERIGICGRSGSGKSTLLLALFRMLEPSNGTVLLDGVPLQDFTARSIRDSMTIVPQNALVLSATVRQNLDPLQERSDADIWNALETCRLLSVIQSFPHGLDTQLDSNTNLSSGQRQLFSLARAILRQRKVLVLDEATSSMDYETDTAVQQVLRTQFRDCTIVTVAHRIATVRDYDRIVVLSAGQIVETDTPDNLMRSPDSIFRSLALDQGVNS